MPRRNFFPAQPGHAEAPDAAGHRRFSSPLVALVGQVRRTGATVNEYGVEVGLPRSGAHRARRHLRRRACRIQPSLIVLMLQQRSMAQMIERQLTHRAAARSVSGMAAVLAHEIKNPLSGIRGAAQLLEPGLSDEDRALAQLICTETDRIRNLVDRMEVFGDERPLGHRAGQHPFRARPREEAGGDRLRARMQRSVSTTIPRCRRVPGNRDKLIQAFLNLVKNAAEAIAEATRARPHRAAHGFSPRRAPVRARNRRARRPAADDRGRGHGPGRGRGAQAAPVRPVRDDEAQGHRPRAGAGRQDHRRPRRHHRMRIGTQAHGFSRAAAAAGPQNAATEEIDRHMAGGTILIADDDSAIRTVLNQALARAGYSPRATGNAATLWRWVSQGEGDVVITDVIMPDENAFDLHSAHQEAAAGAADHRHERAEHAHDGAHGGGEGRL